MEKKERQGPETVAQNKAGKKPSILLGIIYYYLCVPLYIYPLTAGPRLPASKLSSAARRRELDAGVSGR